MIFVEILAWAMVATGALTLCACLLIEAPYGRYSAPRGWGPLIPARIAWALMESPNLWIAAITILMHNGGRLVESPVNAILLCCFLLHYINRSIVYPLRMPASNPMPISVCLLAFLYCSWNGLLQSLALIVVTRYPISWLWDLRFVVGVSLFATGFWVNLSADATLRELRARGEGYVIPKGGLFEYVSCANYTGEILEWMGFALACWSLPAAAFAWYTFSNIGPRGYRHHLWYQSKFEDYPKNRRAVIPFVF